MIKKSNRVLLLLVVMLTVITVVALALAASGVFEENSSKSKELQISNENSKNTYNSSEEEELKGSVQIKISPSEAQKIAETYVKEPGAKVGIPQLDEVNGQMLYTVPIEINGTAVGEIIINALTGENMGGAGGVP